MRCSDFLLPALFAASACTSEPAPSDTARPVAVDTTAAADTDTAAAAPLIPVLVAVRTGSHDTFERVVFEFRPHAPAKHRADYLSGPPVACGSGENIAIDGSQTFAISFSGVDAHEFNGEEARSSIPERELRPALPGIRHLKLTCDFEAEVAWAIGLAQRLPYRVSTIDSTRIAVDFTIDQRTK